MRYFLTLSYDGTAYHGWQIQPNGSSVQETLQKCLSTLLRQPIEVVGAGRTDAGVHASMMVAHFDYSPCTGSFPPVWGKEGEGLLYRLGKMLPQDIAVQKIEAVAEDMHARFSATSRTYHYFVHTQKDPFLRQYSWWVHGNIDFDAMNEAAKVLLGQHDFTSFSKVNTDTKTNLCTITEAYWSPVKGHDGAWQFTVTANRFLRNMVRAIVGTLLEVGRGKMTKEEFLRVIEQKNRCSAGESVPGNALFLVDITYNRTTE